MHDMPGDAIAIPAMGMGNPRVIPTIRKPEENTFARTLNTIARALDGDTFLAASVKFLTVDLMHSRSKFLPFVKCLQCLPNLHTLKIGWASKLTTTSLKSALKGVEPPQIRALTLHPAAHPLIRHCHYVEDIICVFWDLDVSPDGFLRSLAFNHDSKIKRLAIPLVPWDDPSRFVATCPRLTELTVFFPYRYQLRDDEVAFLPDRVGKARSGIFELVGACKMLPDFGTFQIVRFPIVQPPPGCLCMTAECDCGLHSTWQLEGQMKDLEGWAMDCLMAPKTGCQEREGRRTMLKVIEFRSGNRSVVVREYH